MGRSRSAVTTVYRHGVNSERRGILLGAAAYTLWGLFPLYFPLLVPAQAGEVLAHRIIWSLLMVVGALAVMQRLPGLWQIPGRSKVLLAVAAVCLSINWLTYVYGVLSDQVVEASLGYFINPLVTVALGVVVLHERLHRAQIVAISLATVAVAVLTASYGRVPWIALTLAFSFGAYGLLKKQADAPAFDSLGFETLVLILPATAYVMWLSGTGTATFATEGWGHALLLVGLGVVTALPLLLFGAAATSIPLITLGLLQYITPTLQFLIGVVVFQEPMPLGRWVGFVLVWCALIIFSVDSWRRYRSSPAAKSVDDDASERHPGLAPESP